ncbi:ABC transporter ATP-binding protein [Helcococcus sueciensis]|uniref:ABC transporter ATP-binding protein n=1 Tax=Helcococcus sueciensis TaxID=241555 RepID=UPI0004117714|nr:ABC transporter ATP-binding protein [Helcococcus sueciensis]
MIKVSNLSKKYDKKLAVNSISFEIRDGEILGFLGPNGSGKTTTLNMLVGLINSTSGSAEIDGINMLENSIEAKKKIAFLPDNPEIFEDMTGRKFVYFVSNIYDVSKEDRDKRLTELADMFGITDDLDTMISGYSHGMKQKIALISALIHDPEVLMLDEPMVGLDPQAAYNLKELMRERTQRGKSVFFSSHVMDVVEKIVDRIIIIKKGELIFQGTIEELKSLQSYEGDLEKLFLEMTK